MGLHDRPYMKQGGGRGPGALSGVTMGLPRAAPAVKVLLLINVVVFVVQMLGDNPRGGGVGGMTANLGVTVSAWWQVWRYLTFQFLHASFWHILLNMLGLWLLGSPLERHYGTKRFLWFYLSCGVIAGLAYVLIGVLGGVPWDVPIIGASGGVYGIVLACAVYFPQFQLIFLFFPVPIRLAAVIIFGGMILLVISGLAQGQASAVMSDVAHLGGVGMAATWIWLMPRLRVRMRIGDSQGTGRWERKLRRERARQEEIDRILDKIREKGIGSLSRKEKRVLRQETQDQRSEDLP